MEYEHIKARLVGSLRRHGKTSRNRTSPVETVLRNVPQDQKGLARQILEDLIRSGYLARKPSCGRCHVFLTPAGRTFASSN